jgi:1-deoxy-D-xylulose-5-phosphate reductoisomerase
MPKNLIILGSTGSVGGSALRVVDSFPERFSITGLSCHSNLTLFREQLRKYQPRVAAVSSPSAIISEEYREIRKEFPYIEFFEGDRGVAECAAIDCDILLSAIVGGAGCVPAFSAIGHAKRIALANKETLVLAGDIFMQKIERAKCELIPVDSEHSAIFFLLDHRPRTDLDRIIITASGGSFRDKTIDELKSVTPEQALDHPTWNMGDKITIDSATLMNKGFEVIEAHHLFRMPYNKIDVIIHPESVVHSMIETKDGAVYAHLGVTDMAFPVLGALCYPEKVKNPFGHLSLSEIGALTFREPDHRRFPALSLCYAAGKTGGTAPAVLNAANEIAVRAFLDRRIAYMDIVKVVTKALDDCLMIQNPSLEELFEADRGAREYAETLIRGL